MIVSEFLLLGAQPSDKTILSFDCFRFKFRINCLVFFIRQNDKRAPINADSPDSISYPTGVLPLPDLRTSGAVTPLAPDI